jgi:hypothetical protein
VVHGLRRDGRLELVGVLAAACFAGVTFAVNLNGVLSPFDGGISASAASFTTNGLMPYRDYWLPYGPLSGWLLAIPTAVLGPSVELSRASGFGVLCAEAAVSYLVARAWAGIGASIVLAVSATVMLPAMLSLDLGAWPLAMTVALAALYLQIRTSRPAPLVGLLVGIAFLVRLDVGAYALIATMLVRDRRWVLIGFLAIAVPFIAFVIATVPIDAAIEQLVWFPLVGTEEFRGVPGPSVFYGDVLGTTLSVPLILLPRIAILLAAGRCIWLVRDQAPRGDVLRLGALTLFAALCQMQTLGRADAEHLAQAATPALVLYAVWFPAERLSPIRFAALLGISACCLLATILVQPLRNDFGGYNEAHIATSAWVRAATTPDEPLFVGLTSNRYTLVNPLLVYYLADRRPAVRDTMYNPGVTNTDRVQQRMVDDLHASSPPFLVLDDPMSQRFEASNDSRIPGSTILDEYIRSAYHPVCQGILVIEARNDLDRPLPPCPDTTP